MPAPIEIGMLIELHERLRTMVTPLDVLLTVVVAVSQGCRGDIGVGMDKDATRLYTLVSTDNKAGSDSSSIRTMCEERTGKRGSDLPRIRANGLVLLA
jgi:hypothetical protein